MRQSPFDQVQLATPAPPPHARQGRRQARADEEALMGGPGSGRRPDKRCVSECRMLSIGALAGGARRRLHPTGEIIWVATRSRVTLARLLYTITAEHWPQGPDLWVLALRYWPTMSAAESRERIILCEKPGLAYCPNCDEPRRKLYAPPGAVHFLCRGCHDLVYRRQPGPDPLAELQAAMGTLLRGLYADHALIAGPSTVAQRRKAATELLQTLDSERPLPPRSCASGVCVLAGWDCRVAQSPGWQEPRRAVCSATWPPAGPPSTARPWPASASSATTTRSCRCWAVIRFWLRCGFWTATLGSKASTATPQSPRRWSSSRPTGRRWPRRPGDPAAAARGSRRPR